MAMARAAAAPSQLALLDQVGSEMDDETVAEVQQVIVDTGALASLENEISELLEEAWARWRHCPTCPPPRKPWPPPPAS